MDFNDIRRAFDTKENSDVQSVCHRILKINDPDTLRELSHHVNEFVRYLAFYESEETDRYYHYVPSLAAQLLSNIAHGKCRCSVYQSSSADIHTEEENGFIEVMKTEIGIENLCAKYLCKCSYCETQYYVEVGDSGHSIRHEWKKKC